MMCWTLLSFYSYGLIFYYSSLIWSVSCISSFMARLREKEKVCVCRGDELYFICPWIILFVIYLPLHGYKYIAIITCDTKNTDEYIYILLNCSLCVGAHIHVHMSVCTCRCVYMYLLSPSPTYIAHICSHINVGNMLHNIKAQNWCGMDWL